MSSHRLPISRGSWIVDSESWILRREIGVPAPELSVSIRKSYANFGPLVAGFGVFVTSKLRTPDHKVINGLLASA